MSRVEDAFFTAASHTDLMLREKLGEDLLKFTEPQSRFEGALSFLRESDTAGWIRSAAIVILGSALTASVAFGV